MCSLSCALSPSFSLPFLRFFSLSLSVRLSHRRLLLTDSLTAISSSLFLTHCSLGLTHALSLSISLLRHRGTCCRRTQETTSGSWLLLLLAMKLAFACQQQHNHSPCLKDPLLLLPMESLTLLILMDKHQLRFLVVMHRIM